MKSCHTGQLYCHNFIDKFLSKHSNSCPNRQTAYGRSQTRCLWRSTMRAYMPPARYDCGDLLQCVELFRLSIDGFQCQNEGIDGCQPYEISLVCTLKGYQQGRHHVKMSRQIEEIQAHVEANDLCSTHGQHAKFSGESDLVAITGLTRSSFQHRDEDVKWSIVCKLKKAIAEERSKVKALYASVKYFNERYSKDMIEVDAVRPHGLWSLQRLHYIRQYLWSHSFGEIRAPDVSCELCWVPITAADNFPVVLQCGHITCSECLITYELSRCPRCCDTIEEITMAYIPDDNAVHMDSATSLILDDY